MSRTRDLDDGPLLGRVGLAQRLRAASHDNRLVMGGTVCALLVVVPVVILVGLLVTGNAHTAGGLLLLALCVAGGAYGLVDLLRTAGGTDRLAAFAAVNGLTLQRGVAAPHYAGSLFADGSHAVHQSVRSNDGAFLEVGERFPTMPSHANQPSRREVFLRGRLAGPVTRDPRPGEVVTPDLHDRLTRFAGGYVVEVSGDELTVFGSRELDVREPGRVQTAFALVGELVERVDATLVAGPGPLSLGKPAQPGRPRGPLTIVGWTLALLVVGPLLFAVIMSVLDDHLRGNETAARLVVSVLVLAGLAVVGRIVKAAVTPRPPGRRRV